MYQVPRKAKQSSYIFVPKLAQVLNETYFEMFLNCRISFTYVLKEKLGYVIVRSKA